MNTLTLSVPVLALILNDGLFLDQAVVRADVPQDRRASVKHLLRTTLKRYNQLDGLIAQHLRKPLPRKAQMVHYVLLLSACEICVLERPAHAAVNAAVTYLKSDHKLRHHAGLANAVLRKMRPATDNDARTNTPDWLAKRLDADYGEATADAIMQAHLGTPPVDITPKRADVMPDGDRITPHSIRLQDRVVFSALPEFTQGDFWVQDAAAALPVLLLGDVAGQTCLDVAAAPGGKTMQLAAQGAHVTALDISQSRLKRLQENLDRTGLTADVVCADALTWESATYDRIVLDAPCSATGTIRRHPDLLHLQDGKAFAAHLDRLVSLQRQLFDRAWTQWLKPGGRLVYATCSLLHQEGEQQMQHILDTHADATVYRQDHFDVPFVTEHGYLRTTPADLADKGAIDGFFAVCFEKASS